MAFASALDRGSALFANLSQACSAAEYCWRILLSDDYRAFGHTRELKYSSKVFSFDAVNGCYFALRGLRFFYQHPRCVDAPRALNGKCFTLNVSANRRQ